MTKVFDEGLTIRFTDIKHNFRRKKLHRTNQDSNEDVLAVKTIQEHQSNLGEKKTWEATPVLSIIRNKHQT